MLTSVAPMTRFRLGQKVLLTSSYGHVFEPPVPCTIVQVENPCSFTFDYQVQLSDTTNPNWFPVKESWIIPAELVIEEVPDTPWG